MSDIEPTVFFEALNKPHSSAEGLRLFQELGIAESDLEPNPLDNEGRRLYEDLSRGMHLDYKDEGRLREIPYHDIGEGPWILVHYFFQSGVADTVRYSGALPYGISFDMSRADLTKLLGSPDSSNPMVELWERSDHRIAVSFERKTSAIKTVGIQAPVK